MANIFDILEELESHRSRLEKEAILAREVDNDTLHRVFKTTLDPWVSWGVHQYDRPKTTGQIRSDGVMLEFLDGLDAMARRDLKGNAARDFVSDVMRPLDRIGQKWIERILWRNLRCGVSSSTVNKVWPNTVVPFAVQLAKTLDTRQVDGTFEPVEPIEFPVLVDVKLDGLRIVAVKRDGKVTLFTRNGSEVDTLPTIVSELETLEVDNVVFDGEAKGDSWEESDSIIMSTKSRKSDKGMRFHCFDIVDIDCWVSQGKTQPYVERHLRLSQIISKGNLSSVLTVRSTIAKSVDDIRVFYDEALNCGHEGVMVKDINASYEWKRSAAVKKLKPVSTHEGVIIGWYEARKGTKREGKFGGFIVKLPNNVSTRVGGGYSDALKAQIHADGPDNYIRKIVECEAQFLTPDGSMRFPVFLRFRNPADVDRSVVELAEMLDPVINALP